MDQSDRSWTRSNASNGWTLSRVLADGCFDPIHFGHVKYLREASKLGDWLIVRVAPDTAIAAKGRQPIQDQQERANTLLAMSFVDRITLVDTLAEAVRNVKPAVLAKGSDWRGKLPKDVLEACMCVGARIVYTDTRERSSSERVMID